MLDLGQTSLTKSTARIFRGSKGFNHKAGYSEPPTNNVMENVDMDCISAERGAIDFK